jgi:hypothetical protein
MDTLIGSGLVNRNRIEIEYIEPKTHIIADYGSILLQIAHVPGKSRLLAGIFIESKDKYIAIYRTWSDTDNFSSRLL